MTTEEESNTTRPDEAVPILNTDHATEKINPNSHQTENGGTKKQETESETFHSSPKGVLAQSLVAGAVFLLTTCCGIHVGYSAVLIPQLKSENGTLHIDEELGSWIASVQSIASPVGAFLSGLLMDRWGRRTTLILCTLPFMASWLLLAFATNHVFILVARAIAGFSSGLTIGPTQVLVGEISEPRIRGILTGTNFLSHSIGILLVYIMGALLDWSVVSGISTVFPFLSLVAFILLPESPVWLVRQNKVEQAEKALRWLRGGGVGIQAKKELEQLVSQYRAEKEENVKNAMASNNKETCCSNLSKPHILKPFIIVSVFYFIQVTSGTYLVIFYAVEIITQAGGKEGLGINSFLAAVITAVDRLFFTVVMCLMLYKVGRRPLMIISGAVQAFSALALASFLYLKNGINITDYEFPTNKYFIVASLLVYIAANTCGYFSMPGIAMAELLPAKIRGSIGGYILACTYMGFFVTTKIFPWLCNLFGVHGVFTIFGLIGSAGTFYIYLCLPESNGKSLGQIESYFNQPNVLWVGRNRVLRRHNWNPEGYELQVRR